MSVVERLMIKSAAAKKNLIIAGLVAAVILLGVTATSMIIGHQGATASVTLTFGKIQHKYIRQGADPGNSTKAAAPLAPGSQLTLQLAKEFAPGHDTGQLAKEFAPGQVCAPGDSCAPGQLKNNPPQTEIP